MGKSPKYGLKRRFITPVADDFNGPWHYQVGADGFYEFRTFSAGGKESRGFFEVENGKREDVTDAEMIKRMVIKHMELDHTDPERKKPKLGMYVG